MPLVSLQDCPGQLRTHTHVVTHKANREVRKLSVSPRATRQTLGTRARHAPRPSAVAQHLVIVVLHGQWWRVPREIRRCMRLFGVIIVVNYFFGPAGPERRCEWRWRTPTVIQLVIIHDGFQKAKVGMGLLPQHGCRYSNQHQEEEQPMVFEIRQCSSRKFRSRGWLLGCLLIGSLGRINNWLLWRRHRLFTSSASGCCIIARFCSCGIATCDSRPCW